MENFESAQTRSTRDRHCQPGRHPMNMVIRPAIHQKVLALIAKTDATLAEAEAKLPKETRVWFGPEPRTRQPSEWSQLTRFPDELRRYVSGPKKQRKPYASLLRYRKRDRGICIGYSCTVPVPAGRSRCPECAAIRRIKRPSRAQA